MFSTQYAWDQLSSWLDGSLTIGGTNRNDCKPKGFERSLYYATGFPKGHPYHDDESIVGKLVFILSKKISI